MDPLAPGSKELKINIHESIQLDLKPETTKKRRRVDDYDYNDPFLEPFEGEFDVVELECKLENFFIYKGNMAEEPKRIARRYTNTLKKQKQSDGNSVGDDAEQPSTSLFDFEKRLANSINPANKYKKDSKFDAVLIWSVLVQKPATEFGKYLRLKTLDGFKKCGYASIECSEVPENKTCDAELHALHDEIEKMFQRFMECASDKKNFTADMKNFEKFKDDVFVDDIIDFIVKYIGYYICVSDRSLKHTRNLAVEYLHAMLPTQCTNKIRMKYYLTKNLSSKIESMDYDLEKVLDGHFVRKDASSTVNNESPPVDDNPPKIKKTIPRPRKKETVEQLASSETPYSPTNTFSPSFNENFISMGSEFNPLSVSGTSVITSAPAPKKGSKKKKYVSLADLNFLNEPEMSNNNETMVVESYLDSTTSINPESSVEEKTIPRD